MCQQVMCQQGNMLAGNVSAGAAPHSTLKKTRAAEPGYISYIGNKGRALVWKTATARRSAIRPQGSPPGHCRGRICSSGASGRPQAWMSADPEICAHCVTARRLGRGRPSRPPPPVGPVGPAPGGSRALALASARMLPAALPVRPHCHRQGETRRPLQRSRGQSCQCPAITRIG